jgi:hypothetical protein
MIKFLLTTGAVGFLCAAFLTPFGPPGLIAQLPGFEISSWRVPEQSVFIC